MTRWLAIVAVLALAARARADIPPDPRSMSADCVLDAQCAGGRTCPIGLRVDRDESTRCSEAAVAAGLAFRCSGGGNYVGAAVYCPTGAPGACTVEAQCPGGKTCRFGEDCDASGHYLRCSVPVPGTEQWLMVYCPEGVEPPAPGRDASSLAAGCGCSAGAPTSTGLGFAALALLVVARSGRGRRSSRRVPRAARPGSRSTHRSG